MCSMQKSVIYLNRKHKNPTERLFWLVHYACINDIEVMKIYFNLREMFNYLKSHKKVGNVLMNVGVCNYNINKLIKLNKRIYAFDDSKVCKIICSGILNQHIESDN